MTKMHGDHPATCLCCEHLTIEAPFGCESCETRGTFECERGVWDFDYAEKDVHRLLDKAAHCTDFEPKGRK